MKLTMLNQTLSVSGQVLDDDITQLKAMDVDAIVCNRPDGESEGQPSFEELHKIASTFNIEAIYIPLSGGDISQEQARNFRLLLDSKKRIHAFCRTGNRSKGLFNAASRVKNHIITSNDFESIKGPNSSLRFDVVVVGGGSAGIAVAASLLKRKKSLRIAIIEPSPSHFYQPGWTMVGAGIFSNAKTKRETKDVIPKRVTWINESVVSFSEDENYVCLSNEHNIHYHHLVIAAGLKLDWDKIEGLTETLGKNGVTSNYRFDLAPYTWELVKGLKQGTAIFTQPPMPIKCAGAPQKALYLCADQWLKKKCLLDIDVNFHNSAGALFGVSAYVPILTRYMEKYKAKQHFFSTLVKIDGESKTAWFRQQPLEGSESIVVSTRFDMIHVCPPQSAPDFIKKSRVCDINGWLDVNPRTLQHKAFKNVWGLGDVTNTPNAKTMAAVRKQAPVVAQNICDSMLARPLTAEYDGYGSCPLTVERGKIVLAEFLYGGELSPSFPKYLNDGTRPTRFAWFLKMNILPSLYWHCMLKGREILTKSKSNKMKAS